jgi:hypothetical protein
MLFVSLSNLQAKELDKLQKLAALPSEQDALSHTFC